MSIYYNKTSIKVACQHIIMLQQNTVYAHCRVQSRATSLHKLRQIVRVKINGNFRWRSMQMQMAQLVSVSETLSCSSAYSTTSMKHREHIGLYDRPTLYNLMTFIFHKSWN